MLRAIVLVSAAATLASCQAPGAFQRATDDVNAEFALAQQLRDRCRSTGDIDDCLTWREFQENRDIPARDYDLALDRWIANGPY